jgi:hypothetical protein
MRNDIAAGFETLNTMMENNKLVVVLIHIWKDNTQNCADFTVVSSIITHNDIINGDFNAPSNQKGCARTIPMCWSQKNVRVANWLEASSCNLTSLSFACHTT